jgi:hypothetical protein
MGINILLINNLNYFFLIFFFINILVFNYIYSVHIGMSQCI